MGRRRSIPVIYANQVYMANTPWDIQMIFGRIQGLGEGRAKTESLIHITMSPVHAKAAFQILRQQLTNYEKARSHCSVPHVRCVYRYDKVYAIEVLKNCKDRRVCRIREQ